MRGVEKILAPLVLLAGAVLGGCVEPEDNPSRVHDFRILGMTFEPPELMTSDCSNLAGAITLFSTSVDLKALIVDPGGGGRSIDYDISACAKVDEPTCLDTPEQRVELARGTLLSGEWLQTLTPGATLLPDGQPLLLKVLAEDPYQGLGGLRMPVVLHLRTGDEEIYAQKLMVFSCKFFPDSEANITPQLPGVRIADSDWGVDFVPLVQGIGEIAISAEPFDDRQEHYVVPSLALSPVQLIESWRVTWFTTHGTIAPTVTGGVNLGGQASRHDVVWTPDSGDGPIDVTFYVVARDGRGGSSWLTRKVHWEP